MGETETTQVYWRWIETVGNNLHQILKEQVEYLAATQGQLEKSNGARPSRDEIGSVIEAFHRRLLRNMEEHEDARGAFLGAMDEEAKQRWCKLRERDPELCAEYDAAADAMRRICTTQTWQRFIAARDKTVQWFDRLREEAATDA